MRDDHDTRFLHVSFPSQGFSLEIFHQFQQHIHPSLQTKMFMYNTSTVPAAHPTHPAHKCSCTKYHQFQQHIHPSLQTQIKCARTKHQQFPATHPTHTNIHVLSITGSSSTSDPACKYKCTYNASCTCGTRWLTANFLSNGIMGHIWQRGEHYGCHT